MNNERVIGHTEDGQEIVSTKAVLDAKGPFGAIDTLDPTARLRVAIDAAQNFRQMYPDAPKRAAELAVDEVLRLRKVVEQLTSERKRAVALAIRSFASAESAWATLDTLNKHQLTREQSRWFRLGQRFGFYR